MQLALWKDIDRRAAEHPADLSPSSPRCSTALPQRRSPARGLPRIALTLEELKGRAAHYVHQAHADNTRRAYAHDWDAFTRWCARVDRKPLPASAQTLALYLTHLAERGLRPSTIRRARIAIGREHAKRGAPRPDQHAAIRTLERGIGRTLGARENGAPPLLDHQLAQAVQVFGRSPRDERDRALLLLGFAGAFRASDLAGMDVPDVTFTGAGVDIFVRRSKEDQLGRGTTTAVLCGHLEATCPVRALRRWLERVGRPTGPLFRVITGTAVEHQRISTRCVSRAVQRAVARADLGGHYSAHSLRAGLATSAYAHGATERDIQLQGRWRDPRSVQRYVRLEHVPGRPNPATGLL